MDAPSTPPVTPWHKRVLDWLGVEVAADAIELPLPVPLSQPEERFPWEPVPPAPRPPQWGAANLPELLLGLEPKAGADGTVCGPAIHPFAGPAATPST
jgi:hypothetical protein